MNDTHWHIRPNPATALMLAKRQLSEFVCDEELPSRFAAMVADLANITDIYDQAIHLFLTMARCQFFYDVNKRMGRFMMNGHLLQHGYPAINLPAKRQLEFNTLMLAFYASGDESAMNAFLRSCMDVRVLHIMQEA